MSKWYQTIIVNHREEDGKTTHLLDDENYKILCNERAEQLKEIERLQRQKEELQVNGLRQETMFKLEIERLHSIIKEVRELIKRDLSTDKVNNLIYSELLDIIGKENKND